MLKKVTELSAKELNMLISFVNITPISGVQYRLTEIVRNRYGTEQATHGIGAHIYFVNNEHKLLYKLHPSFWKNYYDTVIVA